MPFPQGDWVSAAVVYSLAGIGFWGGIIFNDSLLVDVAAPAEYDLVSAFGYALGYVGRRLAAAAQRGDGHEPGKLRPQRRHRRRASFISDGGRLVDPVHDPVPAVGARAEAGSHAAGGRCACRAGWREFRATLAEVRKYRALVWFLLAYWLYIDGVNTIIKMAVDYGLSLGFPQQSLIAALLITQFVGFPAALAFGWLGNRIGARNGIFIAIAIYAAATVAAYRMSEVVHFYALAAVIGLVQGGIQSLSRSYYAALVPEGKQGEFFGFYNMMGKFAAVLGPTMVGVTALLTRDTRMGMLSIILLFVGGAILLSRSAASAAR